MYEIYCSAISKVMEPVFESQTKTKLGSADMGSELGCRQCELSLMISLKLN
jgi:DNA gyrase/topoisomerase IV subunit B